MKILNGLAWACVFTLFAIIASVSYAGTATVTWSNPTTDTAGNPANLTATRVEYGSCGPNGTFGTPVNNVRPGVVTTATVPNLAPGTWCFRVYATNSAGESVASNVVSKVVPAVQTPPNPPVLSTVDTVAYEIVKGIDKLRLVARGTVAKGIACDAKQSANGLNVIPRASVVWNSDARPQVVVAKCG